MASKTQNELEFTKGDPIIAKASEFSIAGNLNARKGENSGGNLSFGFSITKFTMDGETSWNVYIMTSTEAATLLADLGANCTFSGTLYEASFDEILSPNELQTSYEGLFRTSAIYGPGFDINKTMSVDKNNIPIPGSWVGYGAALILGTKSLAGFGWTDTLTEYSERLFK